MINAKRKNEEFIKQNSISYLDVGVKKTQLKKDFQQTMALKKNEEPLMQDIALDINISEIETRLRASFQQKTSHLVIHHVIITILPKYENARIKSYLSVLIIREATSVLRKMLRNAAMKQRAIKKAHI